MTKTETFQGYSRNDSSELISRNKPGRFFNRSGLFADKGNKMQVVIFDGVCNLCNNFVSLIIRHDKKGVFKFSPIGSDYSNSVEEKFKINLKELDAIVLVENDNIFTKSTAVLKICRQLGFPCSLLVVFYLGPKFIRNKVYDLVARNRYRIFGKRDSCMVPTPDILNRFIS